MVERDEVQELEQRVNRLEKELDEIRRSLRGGGFVTEFLTGFFAVLIVMLGLLFVYKLAYGI